MSDDDTVKLDAELEPFERQLDELLLEVRHVGEMANNRLRWSEGLDVPLLARIVFRNAKATLEVLETYLQYFEEQIGEILGME